MKSNNNSITATTRPKRLQRHVSSTLYLISVHKQEYYFLRVKCRYSVKASISTTLLLLLLLFVTENVRDIKQTIFHTTQVVFVYCHCCWQTITNIFRYCVSFPQKSQCEEWLFDNTKPNMPNNLIEPVVLCLFHRTAIKYIHTHTYTIKHISLTLRLFGI